MARVKRMERVVALTKQLVDIRINCFHLLIFVKNLRLLNRP